MRQASLDQTLPGTIFGHAQSEHAMKLNANDKFWAPVDNPRYLLVIPAGRQEPQNRNQFLAANLQMLQRLQAEAGEEEIQEANQVLRQLETEVLDWMPDKLLNDPRTLELLTSLPLEYGSHLYEWKAGVEEALKQPRMLETEAREEAETLTLVGRISQMIED